MKAYQRD